MVLFRASNPNAPNCSGGIPLGDFAEDSRFVIVSVFAMCASGEAMFPLAPRTTRALLWFGPAMYTRRTEKIVWSSIFACRDELRSLLMSRD